MDSENKNPHQVAEQQIADVMDSPTICSGDTASFKKSAFHIWALVGMSDQPSEEGHTELQSGSHVERSTAKVPHDLCTKFSRYDYQKVFADVKL